MCVHAQTHGKVSVIHVCMYTHLTKNISFIHMHADVRMPTHIFCVIPHVFITGHHNGLCLTLIGDIRADTVMYTVWDQKLE